MEKSRLKQTRGRQPERTDIKPNTNASVTPKIPSKFSNTKSSPNTPILGQFFNSRMRSPDSRLNSHQNAQLNAQQTPKLNTQLNALPSSHQNAQQYSNKNNNNHRSSSNQKRSQSANRYNNDFLIHNCYDLPAKGKTGKFKQKLAITKRTDVQPEKVALWTKPANGQISQNLQNHQNYHVKNLQNVQQII